MERLTFYGMFCNLAMCQEVPCKYPDTGCSQRQVWERLKNIEDILCDNFDTYDLSRIKELVEADREGRCVEVVRCKDCKFWELGCSCHYHKSDENGTPIHMKPEDFCSCGEREEAEKALEDIDGQSE